MTSERLLRGVLTHYPGGFHSARIEPLRTAGGMSGALFWRIAQKGRMFILRRWPAEHPSVEKLRFIHAVLQHLAAEGLDIVPVPLKTDTGLSYVEFDEHLWELAPWMPGVADFDRSPQAAKLASAMRALAKCHSALASFDCMPYKSILDMPIVPGVGISPAILRRALAIARHSQIDTLELRRAIEKSDWTDLAPLAFQFLAAAPRAAQRVMALLEPMSGATFPLQLCLRDIWHDHVLFTAHDVTGLVDFGALGIDTPAGDLARLLGSLVGDDRDRWRSGLDAYEIIRPLSDSERSVLPGLDAAATFIALANWIRWIYFEKRDFGDHAPIVARFARLLDRLRCIQ